MVTQRAAALAKRIENASPEEGIQRAYRLLFHRVPAWATVNWGESFLQQAGVDRWKQYAQVLLSSNEFAYVD